MSVYFLNFVCEAATHSCTVYVIFSRLFILLSFQIFDSLLVYLLSLGLYYLNLFLSPNRKAVFTPLDFQYLAITHEHYA